LPAASIADTSAASPQPSLRGALAPRQSRGRNFERRASRPWIATAALPPRDDAASRPPLPRPCHALLDHAAAKVRIHAAALSPLDCLAQHPILDTLLARELPEGSRFEYPQPVPAR